MARLRVRMAAEDGWSLIELLVAMTVFLFVMGAALSLYEVGVKSAPKDTERAAAVREAQTGLSGMTREVRNAYDIVELTPNVIDFLATRKGVSKRIRYECGATDTDVTPALKQCQRSEATLTSPNQDPLPATGTAREVIGRMLNGTAADPAFSYTMPPQEPLDPEDDPIDYPEAGPCTPPTTVLCLPAPWPTSIGVKVKVPAKGKLTGGCNDGAGNPAPCYKFSVSWSDSLYLRNLEAKQSAFNSGS